MGLPELRRHAPREEALRRQARPPGPQPGASTDTGLAGAVAHHPREGRGGVQVPGTPYATSPPELRSWRATGVTSARRPRRGAAPPARRRGCPTASPSPSRTAASRIPTSTLGIWLIDQWRQIGPQREAGGDRGLRLPRQVLRRATSRSAMDFQCGFIVEPDLDLDTAFHDAPPTPTTASTRTRSARRALPRSRPGRRTPRSGSDTCARSRSGCSTRRRT